MLKKPERIECQSRDIDCLNDMSGYNIAIDDYEAYMQQEMEKKDAKFQSLLDEVEKGIVNATMYDGGLLDYDEVLQILKRARGE